MKKEYETPKVEKMEFDYSQVITTSGRCLLRGFSASWNETSSCSSQTAGNA